MTVFAVHPLNKVGINIQDAERFGRIEYVNQRYVYGDEITNEHQLPPEFQQSLERVAHRFSPSSDYLLMAGDQLQIMALCAMLGNYWCKEGGFSVLRWSNDAQAYMPVRIRT